MICFFNAMTFIKRKTDITIDANSVFKKIKKISTRKTIKKFAAKVTELNEKTTIFVFKQFIDEKFTILKQFALTNYQSKKITNVYII